MSTQRLVIETLTVGVNWHQMLPLVACPVVTPKAYFCRTLPKYEEGVISDWFGVLSVKSCLTRVL